MAKDVSTAENKNDDKKQKKREKAAIPTKLIIRRLPPFLTEEELVQTIGPLPSHDYFRYVKGDASLAPDNYCRAYINISSPDDIIAFRDKVDGLELTDSKGNTQMCILEYAPFQKNPRKTKKREDAKVGTIEEDADYKAFLESLEAEEEKIVIDLEKYLEELEKKEQKHKCIETPLTAFLKQKREERKRLRDERRRLEQERRKKRDEERKRREAERKKKVEAEKAKKKKEDDKKDPKKDDSKKESKEDQSEEKASSSDKKAETQGKGDGKMLSKMYRPEKTFRQDIILWPKPQGPLLGGVYSSTDLEKVWLAERRPAEQKLRRPRGSQAEKESVIKALLGKFESSERTKGVLKTEAKTKKSEAREGGRKGPIGSRPKDTHDEENRDRPQSSYEGKESRGGFRGGYGGGRGSRGRGYRPTSSREYTSRKWDHDVPPRARGKSWNDDQEKKSEKNKTKRPDREIYRPGSGRGGGRSSEGQSGGRPHKYSEQRNKARTEEEK